jgi:hypothetical protein
VIQLRREVTAVSFLRQLVVQIWRTGRDLGLALRDRVERVPAAAVLGEQAFVAELLESALNGAQRWWVMEGAEELLDRRAAESLDGVEDLAVELVWGTNTHPRTALPAPLPAFEVAGNV